MLPILLSIGVFHLFSLSLFIVLAWLVFSFLFWRQMKEFGVDEDKVFDLTFYGTIIAFLASRLIYVLLHWSVFSNNLLKFIVIWVYPGLSLYGALFGLVLYLVFLIRKYKIRLGYLLDSLAWALPFSLIVGLIGGLLDGSRLGKATSLIWAVKYVGSPVKRHPVQIYEIISLGLILLILFFINKRASKEKWPYGMIGGWFFLLFGISQFALEFVKENSIYFVRLSFNQWMALVLVCEAIGALYIKAGGKEFLRQSAANIKFKVMFVLKGAYHAVSQRFTRRNPESSGK
jgi:prolipoprotein diacylglyceryltransferase